MYLVVMCKSCFSRVNRYRDPANRGAYTFGNNEMASPAVYGALKYSEPKWFGRFSSAALWGRRGESLRLVQINEN